MGPGGRPVASGRKWAARLLRLLGTMVIGAAAIVAWVALTSSRPDRPLLVGVAAVAMVVGGAINFAGRRVNPHAGKLTVSEFLGGLLGGAAALMVAVIIGLEVIEWIPIQ